MQIEKTPGFLEKSYDQNIRHICYSLLKDIRFDGEPVVPQILEEKEDDEIIGKHFWVEWLRGQDLGDYCQNPYIPQIDKLRVLLHIVGQLKAIDEAGYVIFDRHGGNIRVLSTDLGHISVRQIDIEDMYDKVADAVYTLDKASMTDELADEFKEAEVSLWILSVDKLSIMGEVIGDVHKDLVTTAIFALCRWHRGEKGHSLEDLEKACKQAIHHVSNPVKKSLLGQ